MIYRCEFDKLFKFNSAHFIVHDDFREPMHGHNYKVSLYFESTCLEPEYKKQLNNDKLEEIVKSICNYLKHRLILGSQNQNSRIEEDGPNNIKLTNNYDNSIFSIPKTDVLVLEIQQATAECLSCYIFKEIQKQKSEFMYESVNYLKLKVKVFEDERKSASFTGVL